jgi:thymidine kinase
MSGIECGSLEIIIGPMFSGKSTKLISIVNRYSIINKKILVINHEFDKERNPNLSVKTHDNIMIPAIFSNNLFEIKETESYKESEVIIIEEAQFFDNLYKFVVNEIDNTKKKLILIGLSGGFMRQKMGELLDLIPMADKITKLEAYCTFCNDETPGIFTHRIAMGDNFIGGKGDYITLCRYHYLLENQNVAKEPTSF